MEKYDVLIIGAGIAGLYAAMELPASKKVLVVCKDIKIYPGSVILFMLKGV